MFRPRVIPMLLLANGGLVKTRRFRDPRYIGDPLNAVRILDDLRADEIVLLDIRATRERRCISPLVVESIGEEANMPFAVGGGIRTVDQIRDILSAGAEKVVIGTAAIESPRLVQDAANRFGSSSVIVCVDVKRSVFGGLSVRSRGNTQRTAHEPIMLARRMQELGAGEIIVQSIDRDGAMNGYDLELVRASGSAVTIPVIAAGGAGATQHLRDAARLAGASAVAAGSMFVFQDSDRGVLISYPEPGEMPA